MQQNKYDPVKHHRRSIRLQDYDYSQIGAYFVTICSKNRAPIFGDIKDGMMHLSAIGYCMARCWLEIPEHFPSVNLDEFVVMPNHLQGIIVRAASDEGAIYCTPTPPETTAQEVVSIPSLGTIIRIFKAAVSRQLKREEITHDGTIWQRNYFEHVIRHEHELDRIRRYIAEKPLKWALDRENPDVQVHQE